MIKNTFNCPKDVWDKMEEEDKYKYNKCMDILQTRNWMEINGNPINDPKILAHNALTMILKSFNP